MPRTRWSRASTSTLVPAARLGRSRGISVGASARLLGRRGSPGGARGPALARGVGVARGVAVARGVGGVGGVGGRGRFGGLSRVCARGLGRLGLAGLRLASLRLASLRLASLRLPAIGLAGPRLPAIGLADLRLAGRGLGLGLLVGLCLVGLAVAGLAIGALGVPGLGIAGSRTASLALALRRGGALRQGLGEGSREDLLLVTARRSGLECSLGSGQALEALPVAGHLEQLADRVGRLCADRQPVLRPVRIDLDQRRICLRVVLPDLLDGTAISLGAGIGDDDPVVGLADLAHAL